MFLCLINLSNSSFALILHVPSLSFVGPKYFPSTFLSNTIQLIFIISFKTHVSQALFTSLFSGAPGRSNYILSNDIYY